MTLEEMAYLAEIVGVIGLIASLIYVGKQIRLNREQLKSDAASRYYAHIDDTFIRTAIDRNFAEAWVKGSADLESLDTVDRQRVINHEIGIFYLWAQWYRQMQSGILPDHASRAFNWALSGLGNRQSIHEAWKAVRESFDEDFQAFIDQYLERGKQRKSRAPGLAEKGTR